MTEKQLLFLKLLRAALWNQSTVIIDNVYSPKQYKSIINMAKEQAVVGLIGDILINKIDGGCPLSEADGLETGYLVLTIQNTHKKHDSVLEQICVRLQADGIDPILLKGEGIASLYPNPSLRQCGDIDIYVEKRKQYDSAIVSIDEIHDINSNIHRTRKHFGCKVRDVEVEIHRHCDILSFRRRKNKYFQDLAKKETANTKRSKKFGIAEVKLPSKYFDSIFILQHLWNHLITGGIGFKQICDWIMVIHNFHKEIDINNLEKDLQKIGLFNAWKYIAYISVNYLGLPEEECPLYSDDNETISNSEAILQLIFDDGNFGKKSSIKNDKTRPGNYFGSKLHSLKNNINRLHNTLKFVNKEDRLAYYLEYLRSTSERIKTKQ